MHPRVVKRVHVLALATGILITGVLPGLPAQAAPSGPPFEIVFPQDASETTFSSTYGAGRSGGRRHNGNDLMAPRLTEVYATADGVVSHVGINRLSGRNIRILHAEGWTSHYVHLNNDNPGTDDGDAPWSLTVAPGVEEGGTVVAGQLIAWVGDSGNAEWTSPHTHFELRREGQPINPYQLLIEAQARAIEHEAWLARAVMEQGRMADSFGNSVYSID